MAISVEDYLAAVHTNLPEAQALVARLGEEHQGIGLAARVNNDLTLLLLWSWRSGDQDTCARVLDVMELALIDTDESDYAPVYNSVSIGMVETVGRDLAPEDFAAFVATWPPALRERGLLETASDDECCDEGPDEFSTPFSMRWSWRHPIQSLRRPRRYLG